MQLPVGLWTVVAVSLWTAQAQATGVGIDEKLGEPVPLDVPVVDESGQTVALRTLVDRPTVFALVYYRCPSICNVLLSGISTVVQQMDLVPGRDFNIVVLSFNEAETFALAAAKKENYLAAMKRPIEPQAWRFLTAGPETIAAITGATGFRYERTGEDFQHAAALLVLTADGRIARYLYGTSFLPFDLKLAIYEAAQGRSGPTINRLLLYCFSYDREGRTYTFNLLKVSGILTLAFTGAFGLFLFGFGRNRHRAEPRMGATHE